jgi:myxalamid-type polyketide synthase MxaE and MxaD
MVLVGRRAPEEDCLQSIEAMRREGLTVSIHTADVGDREQVSALLATVARELPPLRGVIHLAGEFDETPLLELDRARTAQVMRGRALGAWNLHCATSNADLAFFVVFSSSVAVLGSAGQALLAASSAVLDAVARRRAGSGLPGLSVRWGPWGEANEAAADVVRTIEPEAGLDLLWRLAATNIASATVLPFNLEEMLRFYPRAGARSFFERVLGTTAVTNKQYVRDDSTAQFLAPRTETERVVANIVRQTLAIDKVGVRDGFFELGGDSVLAGGVISRINAVYELDLTLGDAIDALTVESLAALIDERAAEPKGS